MGVLLATGGHQQFGAPFFRLCQIDLRDVHRRHRVVVQVLLAIGVKVRGVLAQRHRAQIVLTGGDGARPLEMHEANPTLGILDEAALLGEQPEREASGPRGGL